MEKCKFMSVFAPYMQKFVDAKEALGFSRKYFESVLGLLDRFFIEEKVRTPFITSVLIDKWGHTLINNSYKTICSKYSILAQFAKYMNNIGFPCYVPRIPKSKANTYAPYIFTHEQVLSIFTVCDSLVDSDHGNMDSRLFSIPAIFRLLYGTGMRVSEATSLLNQDINLEKRVITIRKTNEPYVKPICVSEEQAAFTPCKCHGVSIFYFSIRIASEPEQGLCVVQNYIKKMQYSALC